MQTIETQPGLRNFRLNSDALVCSRVRDARRFIGNPPDGVTMHLSICLTTKCNVRTTNTAGFLKNLQVAIYYIIGWFFDNRLRHAGITVTMCGIYALCICCMFCIYVLLLLLLLLFSIYALQPSRLIVRSGLDVPTVTTREHPAAEGGTVGEKCPEILPKC